MKIKYFFVSTAQVVGSQNGQNLDDINCFDVYTRTSAKSLLRTPKCVRRLWPRLHTHNEVVTAVFNSVLSAFLFWAVVKFEK